MHQLLKFSNSLIPSRMLTDDFAFVYAKSLVSTGTLVHPGDNLVLFKVMNWSAGHRYIQMDAEEFDSFIMTSEQEGYIFNHIGEGTYKMKDGGMLLSIYSSLDDILTAYQTSYSIKEDDFSLEKMIVWNRVAGKAFSSLYTNTRNKNGFWLDSYMLLSLSTFNSQPVLKFYFKKKETNIIKNDSISFKFTDNSYVSFRVTDGAKKADGNFFSHMVLLPLSKNDISTFSEKDWDMMRIEHINGDAPILIRNKYRGDYCFPFSSLLFRLYVVEYKKALDDLGIVPLDNTSTIINTREADNRDDSCYVYLMVDTSNGYHKIGISNHPEYRERTLQSEKPTIEKLCAKRFPTRQIATAIESALHASFATKRIRGEWFDLSEDEVAQIIETLS